jgi:hypothetical protein
MSLRLPKTGAQTSADQLGGRSEDAQPSGGPATAIVKMDLKIDDKGNLASRCDLSRPGRWHEHGASAGPETLQRLQKANVQHLLVRTKPGGLYLFPTVSPCISSGTLVPDECGRAVWPVSSRQPVSELINMQPRLERADVDVLVNLPKAANAPAIRPAALDNETLRRCVAVR